MFNKLGYNERLEELVNAKKADESIAKVIKENLSKQRKAKSGIKQAEKEISQLEAAIEEKKKIKSQISILKIKEFSQISREISSLKKELNIKLEEKLAFVEQNKEAILQNSEIEQEIEAQYKIYQENEIYLKVVEKINEGTLELSAEFYAGYVNHMNRYANSMYSLEKDTRLIEPNINDLASLLNILKKSEEKQNSKNSVTTENSTVLNAEEFSEDSSEDSVEEKKVTRKKVAKTEKKEEIPEEEKKTTRKRATKNEEKEEVPTEEKKTTRKRITKNEKKKTSSSEENNN